MTKQKDDLATKVEELSGKLQEMLQSDADAATLHERNATLKRRIDALSAVQTELVVSRKPWSYIDARE